MANEKLTKTETSLFLSLGQFIKSGLYYNITKLMIHYLIITIMLMFGTFVMIWMIVLKQSGWEGIFQIWTTSVISILIMIGIVWLSFKIISEMKFLVIPTVLILIGTFLNKSFLFPIAAKLVGILFIINIIYLSCLYIHENVKINMEENKNGNTKQIRTRNRNKRN